MLSKHLTLSLAKRQRLGESFIRVIDYITPGPRRTVTVGVCNPRRADERQELLGLDKATRYRTL